LWALRSTLVFVQIFSTQNEVSNADDAGAMQGAMQGALADVDASKGVVSRRY